MIKFLFKILLFSGVPVASLIAVFLIENGYSDFYYQRFTTGKQSSLIIGDSKAAQGIVPSILNENINSSKNVDFYNYSFTANNSPFGKYYSESVLNKVYNTSGNYFIVCVDIWAFLVSKDKPSDFIEKDGFISMVTNPNQNPNFLYMLFHFNRSFYDIILRNLDHSYFKLHDDGWLELKLPMDKVSIRDRHLEKLNSIKIQSESLIFSESRFNEFSMLVNNLNELGKVFLVKLPVSDSVMQYEDKIYPDLERRIQEFSLNSNIQYFEFDSISSNYVYTDGLHLSKDSSIEFTSLLSIILKPYVE
ncbi:hypothetical protein SAMN04489724_0661 [Algoriphagus locisalis]|uniref:Uncharacterized protein n=2 Tax=Algoriphagus locisalis TaxID=305507 RepID=A0A1I6XUT4_9BACT|nr:hypothetical protein SAMN04489724_0661 [Algoriphagus locisalis]